MRPFQLTHGGITSSNVRLFEPRLPYHETHVPTFRCQAQAYPRFSRSNEDCRRPQGAFGAARQGPRPARPLIAAPIATAAPGAQVRGVRRFRLTGAGTFEALFRAGRRYDGVWLQLVAAPATEFPGRVGYVISNKILRRAVDRNRVRRALREAVRRARPGVERYDVILRLRRACTRDETAAVVAETAELLTAIMDDSHWPR